MSNLIAIAYPDVATTTRVRDRLLELQRERLIILADAAVAEKKPDGKIKLHQLNSTTGGGAAMGTLWGGLIGMLFLAPLLGMAVGAATGAAAGAATDVGVNDAFMRDLGQRLQPGGAALFLLVTQSTPDKVIVEVAPFGGEIIQTSLSEEAEADLREAVRHVQAVAEQ
ncbi:DUF1269 domain-containing protein [Nonomuraea dietziae]|uniref:Putative membrane protein n=1 Tax=Nonomuraea dietziae TaxID=65515 RepID=A0A7W5V9Q0_9ACTN|nr:DUF1269 domain-containing protein [Nonomuraea dietziae]MBB3727510.1 putative membrane protein [Nonomuraea dietziae]